MAKRFSYDRMPAVEFRQRLQEIGWPDGDRFSFVYGVPHDRVRKWMSGDEDIPHAAAAMLHLLHLPGARKLAIDVAQQAAEPTERERENRRKLADRAKGDSNG